MSRGDFLARFAAKVAKDRGISIEDATLVADDILSKQLNGLRQFGSIDWQRATVGTTSDKIAAGMPLIDDYWHAVTRYATAVERRLAYGSRFGFNGELRDPIVKAIGREGGNTALAGMLFDSVLGHRVYEAAMTRWSRNIVNAQIGSKMWFSAIGNASGSLNTALMFGLRNMVKNVGTLPAKLRSKQVSDDVLRGTALGDTVISGMRDSWLQPSLQTPLGKFANFTLTSSGFNWLEKFNRIGAGATAEAVFIDDLTRGVHGRLRGNRLLQARRLHAQLGIDFDDTVRRVRGGSGGTPSEQLSTWMKTAAGKSTLTKAIFGGVRSAQFAPAPSRIPLFWQHPVGRVFFQFHTFAFNHGKLVRDAVVREAGEGNVRPLATFMSVYPMVGDALGDVRTLLADKKPKRFDGLAAYLDNFSYAGAIGSASDVYRAAYYGRLDSYLLGPTVSNATQLIERLSHGDVDGMLTDLQREPVAVAARQLYTAAGGVVGVSAKMIDDYMETRGEPDDE